MAFPTASAYHRLMKIALPVIALLLLAAVVMLLMPAENDEPVRVTIAVPDPARAAQMDNRQEVVRYFFDTDGHNEDEIKALLERAGQLHAEALANHQPLKIAMVMHGPDLEIFARSNYSRYAEIVDIAERLESAGVIDFKACLTAMEKRGLKDTDMPAFFEMVPFGPEEIQQLEGDGYVRL